MSQRMKKYGKHISGKAKPKMRSHHSLTRILVFAIWLGGPALVFGQDYPRLSIVKVTVQVSLDTTKQMYFYSYKLKNDQNNNGSISKFRIDISRDSNTVAFDTTGLQFANPFIETLFRMEYHSLAPRIVPVGFPNIPSIYWDAGIAPHFMAASFDNETTFVASGDSISGLVLMSKALPGIRKCRVEPDFDVYEWFPSEEDTTSTLSVMQMDSIRQAINFYGFTVGPTAPHIPFDPIGFLDILISYSTRSRTLGWVKNQNVANKYIGLFRRTKSDVQRNNYTSAVSRIDSVLQAIPQDSVSQFTSEAYALLKFNTEYLNGRLQQNLKRR